MIAAIEGNGSRPSHRGGGINDGKVMYTLNSVEVHGVVCESKAFGLSSYNQECWEELSPTLKTPMGGDSTAKVIVLRKMGYELPEDNRTADGE